MSDWKFELNTSRRGRVHVDALDLPSQLLPLQQGVHHQERVAQDEPVRLPHVVRVEVDGLRPGQFVTAE